MQVRSIWPGIRPGATTNSEVKYLRREVLAMKVLVADLALKNRLLKKL